MAENYQTQAKGIRIHPGLWRPHYPWEHIAWVSPSWPCQDYLWLDFPEAIFTDQGLLFLSHINPPFPPVYPNPPAVEWFHIENGIAFERTLPDSISFGGSVTKKNDAAVALELHIQNGSTHPLTRIKLQTCTYLRGIQEFGATTQENKFVHVPDQGWIPFDQAREIKEPKGTVPLGWRSGPAIADIPAMATRSSLAERFAVMTWFGATNSLIGNPNHPCMHADPRFPDLAPGETGSIAGAILFHEGPLDTFTLPTS